MKKIIALLLVCVLVTLAGAALGDGAKFVTVQEWLDAKGECGDCLVLLRLQKIVNPVLAIAADETGTVNLLSATGETSMTINFMSDEAREGDILVIANPQYNEYEGTVEMAYWTIARQMRDPAPAFGDDFAFDNGVRWGMSRQQIVDYEGDPYNESDYNGFVDMFYTREICGFSTEIKFYLLDDRLVTFQCAVSELEEEDLKKLEDAYTAEYGDPVLTDREEFAVLCDYMKTPAAILPDDETCYGKWEAPGGTRILEFKAGEGTVFFAFVSPEVM